MTTPKQSARGRKVPRCPVKGWRWLWARTTVRPRDIFITKDGTENPTLTCDYGRQTCGPVFYDPIWSGYIRRIRPQASGKRGGGRK